MNKESSTSSSVKGGGGGGGGGDQGFIDRSKVRILLCDNDSKSSHEVFSLLFNCSYQVTTVRSPRQAIDALNAEAPHIDIILAEVDLPITKGMKMLKYITRNQDFRRIPVIMMSAQDEVSTVVKCLRLGAADYLVKPLRTNELLNLWTHMWRRRRMLGLAEKNILSYVDLVASDPSDANTNSTTLFSDDTDDKSQKNINLEIETENHYEDEATAVVTQPTSALPESQASLATNSQTEPLFFGPKRKIGRSSAFFTYVKSSIPTSDSQLVAKVDEKFENRVEACQQQVVNDVPTYENGDAWELNSHGDDFPSSSSVPDSFSMERSSTQPISTEYSQQRNTEVMITPWRNDDASRFPQNSYNPYYHVMMQSSTQLYQNNNTNSGMLPQYNMQCAPPHMTSFPCYPPVGVCQYPGQIPNNKQSWPTPSTDTKVDRREAALMKFRQKRKERCFEKKIRYVNRKRLAERRPRVRGQFVRKVNGINVDLNGQPASADDEEDLGDEEDTSEY
ncbi:hypothetical protein ACFE04_025268 [Oxalis oulophora]